MHTLGVSSFLFSQALRIRARKAKASRKPHLTDLKPGIVIENVAQTRRLAETTLGTSTLLPSSGGASSYLEEGPTCTGSGSQASMARDINVPIKEIVKNFTASRLRNCF